MPYTQLSTQWLSADPNLKGIKMLSWSHGSWDWTGKTLKLIYSKPSFFRWGDQGNWVAQHHILASGWVKTTDRKSHKSLNTYQCFLRTSRPSRPSAVTRQREWGVGVHNLQGYTGFHKMKNFVSLTLINQTNKGLFIVKCFKNEGGFKEQGSKPF